MTALPNIDKILRSATEAGDVPGVVALAATREGLVYQGVAGKRALPEAQTRLSIQYSGLRQ